jgi:5-formyltetrahydrofolate cyclo-ligase
MSLADEKRALRERLLASRARLAASERDAAARAAAERLASWPAWARARTVALYAPLGAEMDTAELARRAVAARKRVAWPRLPGEAPGAASAPRAMAFAACAPEELVAGPLGTREPPPGAPRVDPSDLDLVVVPGVAFDEACRRLGRGRGSYDATLAALPPATATVGLAFDFQVVPSVPSEPHDARLHAVVTERRVLGGAAFR